MKLVPTLSVMAGILTVVGILAAGVSTVQTSVAKVDAQGIQIVANATEIKRLKLKRRIRRIEERIWDLQKNHGYDFRTYPSQYAREYQEKMSELEILKSELNGL